NRRVSGPLPAIRDLKTKKIWVKERGRHRDEIIGGTPIWAGQGIKECQEYIDREGLATFIQECQNEVEEREGALWTRDLLNETRCDIGDLPRLDCQQRFDFRQGGDSDVLPSSLLHNDDYQRIGFSKGPNVGDLPRLDRE
ncbi:hypothetical protein LCGC14_2386350, partial [marine sediment metagenome]